jgi:hypothetical protein
MNNKLLKKFNYRLLRAFRFSLVPCLVPEFRAGLIIYKKPRLNFFAESFTSARTITWNMANTWRAVWKNS